MYISKPFRTFLYTVAAVWSEQFSFFESLKFFEKNICFIVCWTAMIWSSWQYGYTYFYFRFYLLFTLLYICGILVVDRNKVLFVSWFGYALRYIPSSGHIMRNFFWVNSSVGVCLVPFFSAVHGDHLFQSFLSLYRPPSHGEYGFAWETELLA